MLPEAIDQRGWSHGLIYISVVRCELDRDMSLEEDVAHFKRMVASLGLPAPAEWIISLDHYGESLLLVRKLVYKIADECTA